MTRSRLASISGIASAALAAGGIALMSSSPGNSDEEIVSWFDDSGNRARLWIGTALFACSILAFVWYASGLRETLRVHAGEQPAALAFGGAIVFAALALTSMALGLGIVATIDFGSDFRVDPNTARLVETFGYLPIFAGAMALSLTVGAASTAARRTGIFPGWVTLPGYVLAPALLLSVPLWGLPLGVFAIWMLVTSVLMLRDAATEESAPSPALGSA